MKKTIEFYICAIDYDHEIGLDNYPGHTRTYGSLKALKEEHPCYDECGVYKIKAECEVIEIPVKSDFGRLREDAHWKANLEADEKSERFKYEILKKKYEGP